MVSYSHANMCEDLNGQGSAHKCTVAVRTNPAYRDVAWVSTKGNATKEGTQGRNAQVIDVANLINAAAMQGDAKVHAVADMTKISRSEGNSQVSGAAVIM